MCEREGRKWEGNGRNSPKAKGQPRRIAFVQPEKTFPFGSSI